MVNQVRPGYVNPLAMMKSSRQATDLKAGARKDEEKKQKALEAEKQLIQNSLLLMKGTSGNGETSKENIELLEKKLEEITNELKANKNESAKLVGADERQAEESDRPKVVRNFDLYEKEKQEEDAGEYTWADEVHPPRRGLY